MQPLVIWTTNSSTPVSKAELFFGRLLLISAYNCSRCVVLGACGLYYECPTDNKAALIKVFITRVMLV
jgi:hypothetical protein